MKTVTYVRVTENSHNQMQHQVPQNKTKFQKQMKIFKKKKNRGNQTEYRVPADAQCFAIAAKKVR